MTQPQSTLTPQILAPYLGMGQHLKPLAHPLLWTTPGRSLTSETSRSPIADLPPNRWTRLTGVSSTVSSDMEGNS